MALYDKETKFYWLQLKEDFFEDDAIEWLEEQQPNGRDYAYFYLKLCLKSLKSSGVLIRKVGNILIPYDNKTLAKLTKMDFDTVTIAMELLKKIGLVEILENGEIYITQLENLIGSVSKGALKKQQQRLIKNEERTLGWTKGGQMSTKDKDKDKNKNKNNISIVEQIISFMNELAGTSFSSKTKKTQSLIRARLAEGFTIEDFKDVINYKYYEWYKNPITFSNGVKSDKYYRPNTLFSTKFEEYLEQYKKEYKEHCDR